MEITALIAKTRTEIADLRSRAAQAATEAGSGQLTAQIIPLQTYLSDLLAANSRRLVGDIVRFETGSGVVTGKVREILNSPGGVELAVISVGATCHCVPCDELIIAEGNP